MSGAVDLNECPYEDDKWDIPCKCGICTVCGYPKHCSAHGPFRGQPPGSQPYDHEYQAMRRKISKIDSLLVEGYSIQCSYDPTTGKMIAELCKAHHDGPYWQASEITAQEALNALGASVKSKAKK